MNHADFDFFEKICDSPDRLHDWASYFVRLDIPRVNVCPHHQAPFDYLQTVYFEPSADQIVWAPRGGGKTRLAALATLLDLLHKPNSAVRILGGSLEQSLRTWEHLLPDIEKLAKEMIVRKKSYARRIDLTNGASAAVLTQSQKAVRGLRVQKLRCDEVELFDREVFEAAQLVTRSQPGVRGSIDLISTMHEPFGLMSEIVDRAMVTNHRMVRWCLLEVLERCPPERECGTCPLWQDCQGIAKSKCSGFFRIDDAIAMKHRVSRQTWDSEILCRRPMQRGAVFAEFDPAVHVVEDVSFASSQLYLAMDFGFNNPFVCLWIRTDDRTVHVIDEHVQSQAMLKTHLAIIEARKYGDIACIYCDPAGQGASDQTGKSNVAILKSHGYRVSTRGSGILEGIDLIRARLRSAAGDVTLFVHPRCQRLIRSLQAYHYPQKGGELPEKDGESDHAIDALRYFLIGRTAKPSAARTY